MAHPKGNAPAEAKSERGDGHRQHYECSEDEEVSMIFGFEEADARQKLCSFPKCARLVISPDLQAELGMEIGTAVSVEHPWKEIKKETLEEHMPGRTKVQRQLRDKLKDMEPGRLVLVGYLPDQSTEEESVFAVFTDHRETREARDLIRRLELVERLWAAAAMRKRARRWQSRDSERDVENFIPRHRTNVVNVESQSIFPAQRAGTCRFRLRPVEAARDGYVALVPRVASFRNIVRKSVDFGVQLRPQKVHKFQQTDPTFPTNAWSQYLYEIGHEQRRSATKGTASAGTQAAAPQGPRSPVRQSVPAASGHVVQLLDTLEFNQIDMYRNDYPLISRRKAIAKYEPPLVAETMCFMERATCANRHVSAIEWHPTLAGMFVAAYVRHIPSVTVALGGDGGGGGGGGGGEDTVNRLVFEKCPVLAWNFEESLVPKLWFDSPREVTALSFCPHDERLLIGGLASGQLAIWELTGAQLEHAGPRAGGIRDTGRLETARIPAGTAHHHPGVEPYRNEIKALLGNATSSSRLARAQGAPSPHGTPAVRIDSGATEGPWHVRPVAISALERSARKPITVIRWLPPNFHCAPTGQLRARAADEKGLPGRFLLTGALDGSVCFWDLEQPTVQLPSVQDKDKSGEGTGPPGTHVRSPTGGRFGRLNNVLQPTFRVRCEVPLVALALDDEPGGGCRMSFIFGTLLGGLCWGKWDGYEFDQGATVNEEPVRDQDPFAPVHDGPLVAIVRNSFVPEVLLTAGGTVLALWATDCRRSPVFWRRKPAPVTACAWSLDRPSVFFVGLANGHFEIWDLQIDTSNACVALNLGANVLSIITQQQQQQQQPSNRGSGSVQRQLAVADGNCNVRLLCIPAAFAEPKPSERRRFRLLIRAELARKHEQQGWVQRYYEQNREQIEARLRAEREARELAERLELEKQEHDDFLRRQALEEAKKKALRDAEKRVDLSRRLECRWRSRYYRALIRTMMARRHLSPELLAKQMYPERERRRYDMCKRATIGESVAAAPDDYRRVQSAFGPPAAGGGGTGGGATERPMAERAGAGVRAQLRETVRARFREELADYPRVSWEAKEVLSVFQLPLDLDSFTGIVAKGRSRRQLVLSDDHGNLEHLQAYLAKQAARGSGGIDEGVGGGATGANEDRPPMATGDEAESTVTNGNPRAALQRARSVTFIDDVPDVAGQKTATLPATPAKGADQQT